VENAGKPLEIIMRGLIDARLEVLSDLDLVENSGQFFSLASLLRLQGSTSLSSRSFSSTTSASVSKTNTRAFLVGLKMRIDKGGGESTDMFPQSNDFSKSSKTVFHISMFVLSCYFTHLSIYVN